LRGRARYGPRGDVTLLPNAARFIETSEAVFVALPVDFMCSLFVARAATGDVRAQEPSRCLAVALPATVPAIANARLALIDNRIFIQALFGSSPRRL
jgi:hypothetical protein